MKPLQMLKACLNWKVLLGLGVVVLLAYLFVPQVANYAWLLLVLACPLSMMFMMAGMNKGQHNHNQTNCEAYEHEIMKRKSK